MSSNIAPVHGGLDAPVDRHVAEADFDRATLEDAPRIDVNETDQTTLYRIADGTLSPIEGPMGAADMATVLKGAYIERGGKKWAWGIPTILPVTDAEAATLEVGGKAALVRDGHVFGVLEVAEINDWDKAAFIKGCYGTDRTDHPGGALWTEDKRSKYVAGKIRLVPFKDERPFAKRVMSPRETRSLIAQAGWEQTIGFQTRNPLHRAHEYALVYGAEVILRETGRNTGVILNPLVGQLKGDDVPAATRMETYERLVEGRFLGDGDKDEALWKSKGQDLNDQLSLIGLDMRMYYGGPREALMHAIYRQNLGLTHFIIGRKHADAPFFDGSPIWGDFDAQEIFQNIEGDLQIKTVNVGFAAYFEELGRVGLVAENKDKTMVSISGTKVREQLVEGQKPDPRIMRPSTAEVLVRFYAAKKK
ncbi:sulfate adenylyltransferase [Engelhardtia mirabilis]|uniref:Sulfate adenylyltransferase n=1 Tax=Engelhardtia mirabilis TaxID=2528011 RepID=A0A518BFZ4_9BACT|nr:Sulfate adenylyltransferase [Planctomycetes bacterium Pla133]QDV00159.1 Sulfate adenylyltransferase [Planctomycetes bacterium Pla86]